MQMDQIGQEYHYNVIARALKDADTLVLATDPDREGEAISWHLFELLKERGELKGKTVHRVAFYEITKNAIQAAVKEPRDLSMDLVNAQQARRVLWDATYLTVSFSPNGKVLAAGVADGSVHFWYLNSAKDSQMRGYGTRVAWTGFSSNSRYLGTCAGTDLIVWDFGGKGPEGSKPIQLTGHTDRIECLAWQPNGPYLVSGGRDWRISLWCPGKASQALDAHLASAEVTAVSWAPNGSLLAVGEKSGRLTIFELVTW